MSLKFLFIYGLMSYVRTPRALHRHYYYPNKLLVYIRAQFLSQAPDSTLMQEVQEKRGLNAQSSSQQNKAPLENLTLFGLILY